MVSILLIVIYIAFISLGLPYAILGSAWPSMYGQLNVPETPNNFGADKSQSIMGMQMVCAYVGATFVSPVFGFIAEHISIRLYPVYLMFFCYSYVCNGRKGE